MPVFKPSIPIYLSNSYLQDLNRCERYFQLRHLLQGNDKKEDTPATMLGSAFGIGIAEYLYSRNKNQAILKTWLAYKEEYQDDRRNVWVCINLLLSAIPYMDNLLLDWKVVEFDNKPAIELSFKLQIDSQFFYAGHVDVCLQNLWTGKYAVLDAKTTGMNILDLDPLYKNSNQTVGYSILLDAIVGKDLAEYDVLYFIGRLGSGTGFEPSIEIKTYPKTLHDRLDWFLSIGLDVERLKRMITLNTFPKREKGCLYYNKPCIFFSTCNLYALDTYKTDEQLSKLGLIEGEEFQFTFHMDELIKSHLERIA